MAKKILFIIPSLAAGGTERVISTICNNIDTTKYDPHIYLISDTKRAYVINPNVTVHSNNFSRSLSALPHMIKTVRALKPDILFLTQSHINLLLTAVKFLLPRSVTLVARENILVSLRNKKWKYKKTFDYLYRVLYKRLDTIICQCEDMAKDLIDNFGIKKEQIVVINNPVDFDMINSKKDDPIDLDFDFDLVTMGRFVPFKSYIDLIEAMPYVDENVTLLMIGDGPDRGMYEARIKELKLGSRIKLLGRTKNPFKYLSRAKLLAFTSRYEGFPNAVLEAGACGLPVVGYTCLGGLNEIIATPDSGLLLKERAPKQLAKAINSSMKKQFDKEKIVNLTYTRYNSKKIMDNYEELFDQISKK